MHILCPMAFFVISCCLLGSLIKWERFNVNVRNVHVPGGVEHRNLLSTGK